MGIIDKLKRAVGMKPKEYVEYTPKPERVYEKDEVKVMPRKVQYSRYVQESAPPSKFQVAPGRFARRSNYGDRGEVQMQRPLSKEEVILRQTASRIEPSRTGKFIRAVGRYAQTIPQRVERQALGYKKRTYVTASGKIAQKYVRTGAPVRTLREKSIAGAFGATVPSRGAYYQGKTGKIGRGRPKGPSGKFVIPGKGAVGVYEYRKWVSYQKRMRSMQQSQQTAQAMARYPRRYAQTSQGMVEMPQSQQQYAQEQAEMPQQSQNYYQQEEMPVQQQSPYQQPPPAEFNALQVPNPFAPKQALPPKVNPFTSNNLNLPTDKPVTNPQGDWYTETDWISGRQVLRRRAPTNRVFQMW